MGRIWQSGEGGGEVAFGRGRRTSNTGQNVLGDWQAVASLRAQGSVRVAFAAGMSFIG